ncbi:hypothetical protein [Amycolatopsis sp. NPDC059657]|uniref:hypothetical protein n=1 Tax=Amycolatopsis sp. NPDC059657 TaxID=3346899 RepID=UPI00366C5639
MSGHVEIEFESSLKHDDVFLPHLGSIIEAPGWVVRERWILGNVLLTVGGQAYKTGKVALIDFGLSLRFSLDDLAVSKKEDLVFDGQVEMSMHLTGDDIAIRGHDGRVVGHCKLADLVKSAFLFVQDILSKLVEVDSDVLLNEAVKSLCREFDAPSWK